MSFNKGSINEDQAILDLFGQSIEYRFRYSFATSSYVKVIDGRVGTLSAWQITPGRSGSKDKEKTIEIYAVVSTFRAIG